MATNNVAIVNSALNKIGVEVISTMADTSKQAVLANEQYDKLRDAMLTKYFWDFAIKRAFLSTDTNTFTDAEIAIGTEYITITAHGYTTGQRVTLTISSTGTIATPLVTATDYFVIVIDANTIQLATTGENAIAGTAIDITAVGSGTHTLTLAPNFEYGNQFVLPTDYLRAFYVNPAGGTEWIIEGDYLFTDESTVELVYVSQITDTTKHTATFDEALALKCAHDWSYPLVQSVSLKAQMEKEFKEELRNVRSIDAMIGTPIDPNDDVWLRSRIAGATGSSSSFGTFRSFPN